MPPPDLTSYTSRAPLANHKTTPHTTPPRINWSNTIHLFMGVNGVPKASKQLTDRKARFYNEKPNQKMSKARGPRYNQTDCRRNGSEKNVGQSQVSHSRQKFEPTPGRNEGKVKNQSNPKTCVCPNGHSSKQGEEEVKTWSHTTNCIPASRTKEFRLKRHEAIMRKQHGRLIGWSPPT
ncbi:hypothetical protein L873DRAFT_1047297 [Choiromyces venosus 120613-1]|uniref:Uncharacterized protein n=1 Tax=Choiromyces venosus 120613-1 TaxID=1336337 RepID=A0A3N4JJ23_9PEZI|nr:hypothetical protein L873DRAFT_1047297 [Choiromyces venosus 120613-1]